MSHVLFPNTPLATLDRQIQLQFKQLRENHLGRFTKFNILSYLTMSFLILYLFFDGCEALVSTLIGGGLASLNGYAKAVNELYLSQLAEFSLFITEVTSAEISLEEKMERYYVLGCLFYDCVANIIFNDIPRNRWHATVETISAQIQRYLDPALFDLLNSALERLLANDPDAPRSLVKQNYPAIKATSESETLYAALIAVGLPPQNDVVVAIPVLD